MTTKFNGATPSELFAEAIKRTVEEAISPMLDTVAEMETQHNEKLDSVRDQLQSHITSVQQDLLTQIGGIGKKVDDMARHTA